MTTAEIKRIAIEVVKLMKKERLPYIKRGGRILYRQSDVMAYINR